MSALLQAPSTDVEPRDGLADEHRLVAAVRRGDDRAFETLYQRYHRRIHAYVCGMVKDHQRAEDVTQEVFVSALRRMRATERPIAFKPWIYEIAKNACIDQFRRSRRAEEVSYDAEEGLAPADYGRLVSPEPVPDAAVAAKQQLDHLCGAFGGLSEAHHQILVMRELEGLSYREIGDRMGLSRPAVESTLFRARRRLTEEYDELASGQRCRRVQSIIATAADRGRLGARDTRRLARHVAHCQPCRREALAAGVDAALLGRKPVTRRAVEKVAGLFPSPFLLRTRRGTANSDTWLNQLPMVSDHVAAGGAKLAAVAALIIAGLGAGVGSQVASSDPAPDRATAPVSRPHAGTPAREQKAAGAPAAGPAAAQPARRRGDAARPGARGDGRAVARRRDGAEGKRTTGSQRNDSRAASGQGSGSGDEAAGGGGGTAAAPRETAQTSPSSGSGTTRTRRSSPLGGAGGGPAPSVPALPPVNLPSTSVPERTTSPTQAVQETAGAVQETAGAVTGAVQETASGAAGAAGSVTGSLPSLP